MKFPIILITPFVFMLCACTSINVDPIPQSESISEVVIRKNPKVAVADFLDVLVDGFQRHGIRTRVVSDEDDTELKDAYVVNYVAYRNWDMAPYLTDATITIDRNGRRVAEARYHLKNKGGLSLNKWQGTATKIDPMLDQLLQGFSVER